MGLRLQGYLLDTNHVNAWFNGNQAFMGRLGGITPERRFFWVSAISVGEIEFGSAITSGSREVAKDFRQFLNREFRLLSENMVLPVDEHVGDYYAKIMGGIWSKHPPRSDKIKTEAHLLKLGVDINDVWIAATAWNHGLTLLTSDNMRCIRESTSDAITVEAWI